MTMTDNGAVMTMMVWMTMTMVMVMAAFCYDGACPIVLMDSDDDTRRDPPSL